MKWLFLWRPPVQRVDARTIETLTTRMRSLAPVTVHATSSRTPRVSVVPFRRTALLMVTIAGDEARMHDARERLQTLDGTLAGYRVEESVPRARRAPLAGPGHTQGLCLLTLFRKNPRLDRERFFREWYGRHTPLSLRIHPMDEYVRNVVEDTVVDGSPWWDGIVTEHFDRASDLLLPWRLFGSAWTMVPNMALVGLHVSYFLDLRSLETYAMDEFRVEA